MISGSIVALAAYLALVVCLHTLSRAAIAHQPDERISFIAKTRELPTKIRLLSDAISGLTAFSALVVFDAVFRMRHLVDLAVPIGLSVALFGVCFVAPVRRHNRAVRRIAGP